MGWWGKLIGGVLGYLAAGPPGALLGIVLGHLIDRQWVRLRSVWPSPGEQRRIQAAFFIATFSVMGRLAKADGRVSEAEIAFARRVMENMALSDERRLEAQRLFNAGKANDFPLEGALERLHRAIHKHPYLIQLFLEIQVQTAYADGRPDPAARELLLYMVQRLRFSRRRFRLLEERVRAASGFAGSDNGPGNGQWRHRDTSSGRPASGRGDRLAEAYGTLGLQGPANDDEVKQAYRRLMNQHHPDKLVARGVPEEMVALATEKTQRIKDAYELIRRERGNGR